MTEPTIRRAYEMWPQYNRRQREVIGAMTPEQLAIRPSPDEELATRGLAFRDG